MSLAPVLPPAAAADTSSSRAWLLALAGFAVMYLPVYWSAAQGLWQREEADYVPILLAVLVWMFWGLRRPLTELPARSAPLLGWPIFGLGLAMYVLGRMFSIFIFEFASQMFIVGGGLLLIKGVPGLRLAWFPVLYFAFTVPLPGILVDAVTGPLKNWISVIVVEVLHTAGYPIARNGVTISIGQYQMLVADACSGLHSMFSLSALGTLFMYVMARKSLVHNAIMLAAILPIAFAANIVRVIVLVLLTYHFGDETGQGFLHGAAGLVLMAISLVMFLALDGLLARVFGRRAGPVVPAA